MTTLITLASDTLTYQTVKLSNPHHIDVPQGMVAVIGPNGAGKSMLGHVITNGWNIMTNKVISPQGKLKIKYIEFTDIHALTGFKASYYQQRYEAQMNDEVPTVGELLGDKINTPKWAELTERLNIHGIEIKKINFLSSGELRKLLIINLLFDVPDVLVLDNPYIGLDAPSRDILNEMLQRLVSDGITIISLVANPRDIPDYADAIIPIKNLTIDPVIDCKDNVAPYRTLLKPYFDYAVNVEAIPLAPENNAEQFDTILEMRDCSVAYAGNVVLQHVNWTVRDGECWSLTGPNGSGKSTLLSLVNADNPKGYCNDITLFDRRRGTGESIWDIKRNIGYISPEMHLYFNGSGDVATIVAQGLNDTVGLFKQVKPHQHQRAMTWLKILHLEHLASRRFNTLSTGEQRMVLIARTLIKNPRLLIMDEPLHGLDRARRRSIRAIVNYMVNRDHLTLIYVTHLLSELPECITHHKTL